MSRDTPCILLVDDEPFYHEIVTNALDGCGYTFHKTADGAEAWAALIENPERFDAVILDRFMPIMDGMETLQKIKASPQFKNLPVIMQTAADSAEEVAEGLAAGAWYYLAKPFRSDMLSQLVAAALADNFKQYDLVRLNTEMQGMLALVHTANFRFRTPQEARQLARVLANTSPNAEAVAMGLSELMVNAIEHGNLAIGYGDKSRLMADWRLEEELDRRLLDPILGSRWAELEFQRESDHLRFSIRDQGTGFDWSNFLDIDPERAFDSHGRGIALARKISFTSIEYRGCGNEVTVTVAVDETI